MEPEITVTYYFHPQDFINGKMHDGTTFRDIVKEFEYDFHKRYSTEYAELLYANSSTMRMLEKACGAAPFLMYGMELTNRKSFNPGIDAPLNFKIDRWSEHIMVYGIDSAFMMTPDYNPNDEEHRIYPLTLLIDDSMRDGTVRLATPTIDGDDDDDDDDDDDGVSFPEWIYGINYAFK